MKIQDNQYQANFNVECRETQELLERMHRIRKNHKHDELLCNIGICALGIIQLIWAVTLIMWYLG